MNLNYSSIGDSYISIALAKWFEYQTLVQTGNPTPDFVHTLSNYSVALELVINWAGKISERLGKLGVDVEDLDQASSWPFYPPTLLEAKQNPGPSSLQCSLHPKPTNLTILQNL